MAAVLGNLDKYTNMADFEEAMVALAADMAEPWEWNQWQKAASGLLPHYPTAPRDTASWSARRKKHMEDRFGADWVALLQRARAAKAGGQPPVATAAPTRGSVQGPVPAVQPLQPGPLAPGPILRTPPRAGQRVADGADQGARARE